MSEFSAEWLALREPSDHAARSMDLTQWVLGALPRDRDISILDLACGTGSNLRYLQATLTGSAVRWLLVDEDAALLARVPPGAGVVTRQQNLATLPSDLFEGQTLITASALLDLVSAEWLRELACRCADVRAAAALFALTYDGRIECAPAESEDAMVRELVNRHQRTDKGFGPALGPGASAYAEDCFAAAGYEVRTERSDWVLEVSGVQRQLIKGWADAATEMAPADARTIADWQRRRLEHVDSGRSRIVVGHIDLAAAAK